MTRMTRKSTAHRFSRPPAGVIGRTGYGSSRVERRVLVGQQEVVGVHAVSMRTIPLS